MRGATIKALDLKIMMLDFNPRAHEGHDERIIKLEAQQLDFNPRAHEGHDLL